MDFNTWLQISDEDKLKYLQDSDNKEVMDLIDHLCKSMILKSGMVVKLIDEKRLLYSKISSNINLENINNKAMTKMCLLCKAKRDE